MFTAGSLLCSLAPGLGWLIAFRMVQAVGGSMLNPVAMSIITNTFTDRRERARAIGVWGGVFGLSMALGPVVGGALVDSIGWRGIFWVNIPVGVAAIVLAALFVPESKADRARTRPDPVGQALLIVLLASLTYAIIEGPAAGWGSPVITGLFAVAGRRAGDLRVVRVAPRGPAARSAVLPQRAILRRDDHRGDHHRGAGAGSFFLNTLYLQEVRGFRALTAGLYLLPMALAMAVGAPLSGRIVASRGARVPLVLSGIALIVSGVLLTRLTATSGIGFLFPTYVIFGFGLGLVNAPITNSAVSGMPRQQAGVAAGVASASRQVGQSLGVAVMGSILSANLRGGMRAGFVAASRPGWWIVAACGAVTLILALVTTGSWAQRTAKRTADLLSPADERSPVSVP